MQKAEQRAARAMAKTVVRVLAGPGEWCICLLSPATPHIFLANNCFGFLISVGLDGAKSPFSSAVSAPRPLD